MLLRIRQIANSEEPIAKAVKNGWSRIVDWWFNDNISTAVKVLVLIGAGLLLLANAQWIVPLGLILAIPYLIYYAVRVWTLPTDAKPRNISKTTTVPGRRLLSKSENDPSFDKPSRKTTLLTASVSW